MARHPFHEVAIVGVYNTQQARVLEGHDSRSHHPGGRARRPGRRRARRPATSTAWSARPAASSSTRPGSGRRGGRCRSSASPRCSRPPAPSPTGWPPPCWSAPGRAGVYTDRASTAPWTRPANEFVAPYGMFTAAEFALDRPPPHAHVRHHARGAGHRRRDHPQQRPRQPRGRLLRARPVHARGHPRQPHGRRPVPPARLRHDVRGRLRRWC